MMLVESVGKKETLNERFESVRVLRVMGGLCSMVGTLLMGPVGTVVVGASCMASLSAPAPAAMMLAV